jgi:hypothetical protein
MQAAPSAECRSLPPLALIAVVATAALILGLLTPRQAAAGEYTIYACQADEAGYVSAAFENFATRGMKWRRACDPRGEGLRGLVTANVARDGRVEKGAQSGFILDAPPGTSFSRLRWSGQAWRRDCRYALQLFAQRPDGAAIPMKNVRANRRCPRPGMAQKSGAPFPRAYDLGDATRIVQRVVCMGSAKHQFCSARGRNYIRTFSAEATVVDGIVPSVGILQGERLTRGEWARGKQGFTYNASDNVGVKAASALIAGGLRGSDPRRACSYSQRVPCPNGFGTIEINTAEAPEGSQPLTVVAEDAAGNRAESAAVTVRIDNTPPGAVPVGVAGGETWRNSNDFDLAWTNPAEPDRAPITAAHYRLCRSGGDECVNGDPSGTGIASIDNIAVPSPGEWELRLWREDAASNQQPANASQAVKLRFDPEPPQLGFEKQTVEDPTRVSVLVTDRISGLAGGGIEISRAGSGSWQVLPTAREGDRLVTRIDDASLPPGDYELRATAHDRANNLAGTERRLDGQPMRLKLPLRVATAMKAGVVEKRIVGRKGKKGKVRRTVLEPRAKVPFGRRVRLGGRLVNQAGHALSGAKILVYSRPKEGTEQIVGSVTTDANGRFSHKVEARASQSFRFVYPGTATILPVEASATLLVKGTSTFAVKPKRVQNGDSVIFSGRVKGRPLSEAGKLLELQVRFTSGWQTFRTVRAEPDGAWRIPYLFDRTCGEQEFDFRAHVAGEAGWPLDTGNSRTLTVRVKGRPC